MPAADRPRRLDWLALALPFVVLSGCVAADPTLEDSDILIGQVDRGHPAVGMLAGPYGGCTGTLVVDSCTVLTAAHCALGGAYRYFYVGGERLPVRAAAVHPSYDPDGAPLEVESDQIGPLGPYDLPAADIAILKLATCSAVAPMPIATRAAAAGEAIRPIGFGLKELQPPPDPEQEDAHDWPAGGVTDGGGARLPSSSIDPYAANGIPLPEKFIGDNHDLQGATPLFTFEGADGLGATTCSGDSGGPTVRTRADGVDEVVGVHSAGMCQEDVVLDLGADFDWRFSIDMQADQFRSFAAHPAVCTPGQTASCDDACTQRVCDREGMWPLECTPTYRPACPY